MGWPTPAAALKAAEQLGQAPHFEISRGVEQACEHSLERTLQVIAGQTECDQRVIMRPDRAVVVRHWIVARFRVGNGANPPPGKKFWPQQTVGHLDGSVKPGDTGEQNLAGIGAADSAGLLVPVERQRVRAQLRTPEARVESLGELIGFSLEEPRALGPAEPFGAARQNLLGAVHVPLHLRYRDWALSKAPVGMKNRIL